MNLFYIVQIVYTDGDVEKLSLIKECWKFTDDDGGMDVVCQNSPLILTCFI